MAVDRQAFMPSLRNTAWQANAAGKRAARVLPD
jgi:hypothetical protein